MKTLIISNGELGNLAYIQNIVKEQKPYIICVDGGLRHASTLGVCPQLIVGDFDSVNRIELKMYKQKNIEFIQLLPEKDETDTQIAIEEAIQRGATEIIMTGVIGTRFDHSYGNIMLLSYLNKKKVKGRIIHTNNIIRLLSVGKHKVVNEQMKTVSLLPFGGDVTIKRITGFKYDVSNLTFVSHIPLGISNEIIKNDAEIDVESGELLMLLAWD